MALAVHILPLGLSLQYAKEGVGVRNLGGTSVSDCPFRSGEQRHIGHLESGPGEIGIYEEFDLEQ